MELLKKALINNARGYDAKDDRMGNNPNQMNIQSMYSDIDLDANGMETEFQAAFEELLWFINQDLANKGKGDFEEKMADYMGAFPNNPATGSSDPPNGDQGGD